MNRRGTIGFDTLPYGMSSETHWRSLHIFQDGHIAPPTRICKGESGLIDVEIPIFGWLIWFCSCFIRVCCWLSGVFNPSLLMFNRSLFLMVNPLFTCLIPVFWWSNSKNTYIIIIIYIRWANPNFWWDILNWFVGALVHEEMLKLKKKLREIQKIEDRNCLRSVVRHVFFSHEVMLRCSSARTVFVALAWFAWCTRILFEVQTHVVNQ